MVYLQGVLSVLGSNLKRQLAHDPFEWIRQNPLVNHGVMIHKVNILQPSFDKKRNQSML